MRRTMLVLLAFLSAGSPAATGTVEHEAGRKVYNFRCYFCHGYSGNGRTLAASFVTPAPADFTRADAARLTPQAILETLRQGRPGTAMKSFAGVVPDAELRAVANFVFTEFVLHKSENTRYHTAANGWPDHERYRSAFVFATGEITLSHPWESLTPEQAVGRRLYLASCVSCHDRGAPDPGQDDTAWDSRPLSYPRNHFSMAAPPRLDAITSASPYAKHDRVPRIAQLSRLERRGERLFQANCAFCHGADGSGKNWIGQFLEPHPRNLRDPSFMRSMSRERLVSTISHGLPGTSMPAWREVLSARDIRAVVDYVSRAFHPLPRWQASDASRRKPVGDRRTMDGALSAPG
jgi:cytochrome c oxidase cbb3-type subunit 3